MTGFSIRSAATWLRNVSKTMSLRTSPQAGVAIRFFALQSVFRGSIIELTLNQRTAQNCSTQNRPLCYNAMYNGVRIMSADCLFVLRSVTCVEKIKQRLQHFCDSHNCGLLLDPIDALIVCGQVCVENTDFAFEITNSWNDMSSDLLLGHDGYVVNGKQATLSLHDRLMLLQNVTQVCLRFCMGIDIYISYDNPFLPEYIVAHLECCDVASYLYELYQKSKDPYPFIPNVHIHIG